MYGIVHFKIANLSLKYRIDLFNVVFVGFYFLTSTVVLISHPLSLLIFC